MMASAYLRGTAAAKVENVAVRRRVEDIWTIVVIICICSWLVNGNQRR